MTMLQMVGVIILALGLPAMYASIAAGDHVDNRVWSPATWSCESRWWRSGYAQQRQDPTAARGLPHIRAVVTSRRSAGSSRSCPAPRSPRRQRGPPVWCWSRCSGRGSPNHAWAARRGTPTTSPSAMGCSPSSRSARASSAPSPRCRRSSGRRAGGRGGVLVAVAGTGLTFGMWWMYFIVPQSHCCTPAANCHSGSAICTSWCSGRSWRPGAGLHAGGLLRRAPLELGSVATVSSVAIPVGVHPDGLRALRADAADD